MVKQVKQMAANTVLNPAMIELSKLNLMRLPADDRRVVLRSPEQMRRVGEVCALDVLFNNMDRIPCLESWDRMKLRGNPNNLMANQTGQVCLIDLVLTAMSSQLSTEYFTEVRQLLDSLCECSLGCLTENRAVTDTTNCQGATSQLQQEAEERSLPDFDFRLLQSYQQDKRLTEIVPAVFQIAEHFLMHFEHIAALPDLRAIQQGIASGVVKIAASMSATKLREIKQYVADSTMPPELLGGADGYAALYPTANEIWQNDIDAVDLVFVGELLSLFKEYAPRLQTRYGLEIDELPCPAERKSNMNRRGLMSTEL